jgi:hypothetical protein
MWHGAWGLASYHDGEERERHEAMNTSMALRCIRNIKGDNSSYSKSLETLVVGSVRLHVVCKQIA